MKPHFEISETTLAIAKQLFPKASSIQLFSGSFWFLVFLEMQRPGKVSEQSLLSSLAQLLSSAPDVVVSTQRHGKASEQSFLFRSSSFFLGALDVVVFSVSFWTPVQYLGGF